MSLYVVILLRVGMMNSHQVMIRLRLPNHTPVCRSGQLRVLLQRLESNDSQLTTATVTRQRIRDIIDVAGYASDVATPHIQLRQPEYFNGTLTQ